MSALAEARGHLDRGSWYLLGVLGAASFFDGYDASLIAIALPAIRKSFHLSRPSAYVALAIIFMGTIPAMLVARKADRIGRRRVLLVSIVGYTVFSGSTFFAHDVVTFTIVQFLARVFITAEAAIAHTMIAEELPAKARGFGFGFLATLVALGTGVAAIVNGAVFAPLGIDWHWLFLVGVPPLVVVTFLRRKLPESRRFEQARADGRLSENWTVILQRPHRRWLFLVCLAGFLAAMIHMPTELSIDFLQHDRGMSQMTSNLLIVTAGFPAILLMVWAGALSDRLGRKLVGVTCATLGAGAWLVFYLAPGGVAIALPSLMFTIVGFAVAAPLIGAYNAELFPTAVRSQAASWAAFFRASGQSMSFLVGYTIERATHSLSTTAAILTLGPISMILIVAVFFPETKGLELEETSGEEVAAPELVPFSAIEVDVPLHHDP